MTTRYETETEHGRGLVLSWASLIDDATREQAERTSRSRVIAGHLALMPDCHFGMGATVGSVMRMKGGVIVAAIGVDIGCGILAVRTDLARGAISEKAGHRILGLLRERIPSGVGQNHPAPTADAGAFFAKHGGIGRTQTTRNGKGDLNAIAAIQFGTLGSGNHFAEFSEDGDGMVWLIVHSGSRALGMAIAESYCAQARDICQRECLPVEHPDLAFLPEASSERGWYLEEMFYAQRYAWAQREAMMARMLESLADEIPGWSEADRVHCHHNYAVDQGDGVLLTRKGAIAAGLGQRGTIPGSMGAATHIVKGLGNYDAYDSAPHGAGRLMSRGQARRTLSLDEFRSQMAGRTWQDRDAGSLIDEAPGAYKPIETVMRDAATLVETVAVLRQFINYKGVDAGRYGRTKVSTDA